MLLFGVTMLLVLPVFAILGYLLVKAWPALSPAFILDNPKDFMRAGGIWAPLVGTFFLVLLSLLVAAPVGILAGIYLNEYARDNWFTRVVNLAVMNLAGVPSIVHALFGVGAFVLFAGMGRSALGRLVYPGGDDPAGDYHQHPRGPGLGADGLPRGLLEPGGQPLADDPHDRAAQLDQRHPDRRDPPSLAGRGRDGPDPVHRGGVLRAGAGPRLGVVVPLWAGRPLHGPVDAPLHALHPGLRRPRRDRTPRPWCSSGWCLAVNASSIGLRVYLRSRKKW